MKKSVFYLMITFSWTWICWIGAYVLSKSNGLELNLNLTLVETLKRITGENGWVQFLFSIGVYGPLIGYVITKGHKKMFFKMKQPGHMILFACLMPIIIILPTFLVTILTRVEFDTSKSATIIIGLISIYLLSNLVTSGTEEFGWRGVLYSHLRESEKTFWDASWKGGLIWAVWHYPLMVMLYRGLGIVVLIPTLIGFTAGIVAMSYISNYIFERTKSIPLLMGMHALNNTMSYILILLFPKTPFTILIHLMAWAVVVYLEKRNKIVGV